MVNARLCLTHKLAKGEKALPNNCDSPYSKGNGQPFEGHSHSVFAAIRPATPSPIPPKRKQASFSVRLSSEVATPRSICHRSNFPRLHHPQQIRCSPNLLRVDRPLARSGDCFLLSVAPPLRVRAPSAEFGRKGRRSQRSVRVSDRPNRWWAMHPPRAM